VLAHSSMQVRRLNARIQTPVGRGDDRESLATVGGWTMPPDVNTGIEALAALGARSWAAATAAADPLEGTSHGGTKPSCSIGRWSRCTSSF